MSVMPLQPLPGTRLLASLQAALRAAGGIAYEYEPLTGRLAWPSSGSQVLGLAMGQLRSLDAWLERVHPDDRLLAHAAIVDARIAAGGAASPSSAAEAGDAAEPPQPPSYRVRDAAGAWRWLESRGARLEIDGRLVCVGVLADVTDQRAALQRAALPARILESIREAVAVTDRDGLLVWANAAFARLVGAEPQALQGRALQSWCAASEAHRLEQHQEIRDTVMRRGAWHGRIDMRRGDGQLVVTESAVTQAGDDCWVHVRRDVTERIALDEAAVAGSRREQRDLGLELHDRLGQELAGTSMLVSTLRTAASAGASLDPALLRDVEQLLQSAVARCRDLAQRVSPFVIDDGGLGAAVEDLATRTRAASGVALRVEACPRCARLDGNFGFHLFRLVQLALATTLEREGVTSVDLQLWWEEDERVALAVVADGRHAPFAGAGADARMLAHRLALLGGSSEPLSGSRGRHGLIAMVPVPVEGATSAGLRSLARRA